jgi:hypothetical protein
MTTRGEAAEILHHARTEVWRGLGEPAVLPRTIAVKWEGAPLESLAPTVLKFAEKALLREVTGLCGEVQGLMYDAEPCAQLGVRCAELKARHQELVAVREEMRRRGIDEPEVTIVWGGGDVGRTHGLDQEGQ